MAYYIKVTPQVCKKLGHGSDRNKTADGNKLLWQADIDQVDGQDVFERAQNVGGVALTPIAAKAETDGVDNPVEVFTPDIYQDDVVESVKPLNANVDNAEQDAVEKPLEESKQEPSLEELKEEVLTDNKETVEPKKKEAKK